MKRRSINVFSLSFLDAMTCGFGAVVLFFMVINSTMGERSGDMTADLSAEADRIDEEVLDAYKMLVQLRNSVEDVEDERVQAAGLNRRILERLKIIQEELATYEASTLSRQEHVNRLKSDLKLLEKENKRLSAVAPSKETPGDKLRTFVGDGDRQYLTGLKVGGERILILVDASASMLDATIVNILRRRNLPDKVKRQAEKWQQAVRTVDWLTTQVPRDAKFQIYVFDERARPVTPGTAGSWLDAGDRKVLDSAVAGLKRVVPNGPTSLENAFAAIGELRPRPDNLILLVDGLPTMGEKRPRDRTVSPRQREKHFDRAVKVLPAQMPINVVLFPMEGDPKASSAYWRLALASNGSFMSPSEDWP